MNWTDADVITPEIIAMHKAKSTSEIENDLAENEEEITALRRMAVLEAELGRIHIDIHERKIMHYKSRAREGAAIEREHLSRFLRALLTSRATRRNNK